jgi:hypothetical protein
VVQPCGPKSGSASRTYGRPIGEWNSLPRDSNLGAAPLRRGRPARAGGRQPLFTAETAVAQGAAAGFFTAQGLCGVLFGLCGVLWPGFGNPEPPNGVYNRWREGHAAEILYGNRNNTPQCEG